MYQHALTASAAAVAIALAPSSRAQSIVGAPIIVPGDNITITLEFLSADAAYTGELSFLGAGTPFIITMPAIDTGEVGLGQQTFVNQTGESGSVVALEGVFNAGDVLHFGYRVFAPANQADVLRTDDVGGADQFAWDAATGMLSIEDLRPGHPWYDADYNDIIVRVNFNSVPAPASAVMLFAGGVFACGRRRCR